VSVRNEAKEVIMPWFLGIGFLGGEGVWVLGTEYLRKVAFWVIDANRRYKTLRHGTIGVFRWLRD